MPVCDGPLGAPKMESMGGHLDLVGEPLVPFQKLLRVEVSAGRPSIALLP